MSTFCTYFDHRYLPRGLALYESLRGHVPDFRLWVLCLSPECHRALTALALPGVMPVALETFEDGNAALAAAKANRSLIEYYFTCTSSFMDWVLAQDPAAEVVTYLDSDLFFFSDPAPLFDALAGHSTLIIRHNFTPANRHLERFGLYNVGWVSFRRDAAGLACLRWWRDRCLEWCYDRLDGDRFADQKYLDQFAERFPGVLDFRHAGANLAPWNIGHHRLTESPDGGLVVDGQPLVFFHFHDMRRLWSGLWHLPHHTYGAPVTRLMRQRLYAPYVRALQRGADRAATAGVAAAPAPPIRHAGRGGIVRKLAIAGRDVVTRNALLQVGQRVF